MKRIVFIISLFLLLQSFAVCQENKGLFNRGYEIEECMTGDRFPGLPGYGGSGNQDAPVGSSVTAMLTLASLYILGKKSRNKDN